MYTFYRAIIFLSSYMYYTGNSLAYLEFTKFHTLNGNGYVTAI